MAVVALVDPHVGFSPPRKGERPPLMVESVGLKMLSIQARGLVIFGYKAACSSVKIHVLTPTNP